MDDLRAHRGQCRGLRAVQHPAGRNRRESRRSEAGGGTSPQSGRRCRRACRSPRRSSRSRPTTCSCSTTASDQPRAPGDRSADVDVPARRLHAPVRQHAVPLDLRRQRRVPPRAAASFSWLSGHRRRGHAVLHAARPGFDPAARRRLGRHFGRARLLLPLVPAQRRPRAGVPVPHPDAGVRDSRRASSSASTWSSTTCCR